VGVVALPPSPPTEACHVFSLLDGGAGNSTRPEFEAVVVSTPKRRGRGLRVELKAQRLAGDDPRELCGRACS
jgi:hypothetical protein